MIVARVGGRTGGRGKEVLPDPLMQIPNTPQRSRCCRATASQLARAILAEALACPRKRLVHKTPGADHRPIREPRRSRDRSYREAAKFIRCHEGFDEESIASMIQSAEQMEA